TSHLLVKEDLCDRMERGKVTHVVTNAAGAEKFAEVAGAYSRIIVGDAVPGWTSYERAYDDSVTFRGEATRVDDPFLLYFTSGTTAKPKLVLHTQRSYPIGHLSTMYLVGLRPDDLHWNISSPGWAKHAYSSFFAPWNAGATIFVY